MNAPLCIPTFVPVPLEKGGRDKQRAAAAVFRDLLYNTMLENGPMGAKALADLTGSKVNTVRDYLHAMIDKKMVEFVKVKGQNHPTGGTVMCLYMVSCEPQSAQEWQAKQRTVTEYPLHHVRDSLVAALFGAKQ